MATPPVTKRKARQAINELRSAVHAKLADLKKGYVEVDEEEVARVKKIATLEDKIEEAEEKVSAEIESIQRDTRKLLKLSTFEPEYRYWLDTGSPELNATLGSKKYGLPYGKIYELSGMEHGGKTTLSNVIAGIAQKDGAAVGYIDLEDSRDPVWARKLGLDFSKVLPVFPKLLTEGKKTSEEIRLQSAEEVFKEAEVGFRAFARRGYTKQFWLMDSIANIQTAMAVDAGTTDWNMRVNADRAMFLSRVLPRWAGLCANYNVMLFCLNQLRNKLGMVFGDPSYSPGGRALAHACSIRARVRRLKNGKVTQGTRTIGILGVVTNTKNKAGKGSTEGDSVAFKIRWDKNPATIKFMTKEEAED